MKRGTNVTWPNVGGTTVYNAYGPMVFIGVFWVYLNCHIGWILGQFCRHQKELRDRDEAERKWQETQRKLYGSS